MAEAAPSDPEPDPEQFQLRRRLPPRFSTLKNDVYITPKTNFKAQLARCERLLGTEEEVRVHGLGLAVNRALNLCLQLKRRGLGSLELDMRTSTVAVTDDLFPLIGDDDARSRTRFVSAVHIRVFKPPVPVTDF